MPTNFLLKVETAQTLLQSEVDKWEETLAQIPPGHLDEALSGVASSWWSACEALREIKALSNKTPNLTPLPLVATHVPMLTPSLATAVNNAHVTVTPSSVQAITKTPSLAPSPATAVNNAPTLPLVTVPSPSTQVQAKNFAIPLKPLTQARAVPSVPKIAPAPVPAGHMSPLQASQLAPARPSAPLTAAVSAQQVSPVQASASPVHDVGRASVRLFYSFYLFIQILVQ